MSNYPDIIKINEIFDKVIEVLKCYDPTEASCALSDILASMISFHCIDTGADYNQLLKDLQNDIKNLTELYINARENGLIKAKV